MVRLELHPVTGCSTVEMVVNRNIWNVAIWLVARHGTEASKMLSARITKLREAPEEKSVINSWLLVDHAVHELIRPPEEHERIN
jgi:hypothetical protein